VTVILRKILLTFAETPQIPMDFRTGIRQTGTVVVSEIVSAVLTGRYEWEPVPNAKFQIAVKPVGEI